MTEITIADQIACVKRLKNEEFHHGYRGRNLERLEAVLTTLREVEAVIINPAKSEHASDCAIHLWSTVECDCSSENIRPAGFGIPPEDSDLGRPE